MNIEFINKIRKPSEQIKLKQKNSKAPTQMVVDSSQPQWG